MDYYVYSGFEFALEPCSGHVLFMLQLLAVAPGSSAVLFSFFILTYFIIPSGHKFSSFGSNEIFMWLYSSTTYALCLMPLADPVSARSLSSSSRLKFNLETQCGCCNNYVVLYIRVPKGVWV
ncbi:hypothetical protein BD408DRAFT_164981 [Parasitella parasitica]|nr:hypothetical protein BD408DRAFT_164981 [Parasitella parasitica]